MKQILDVIVPVHDNPGWARLCFDALRAFTKNAYHLVIVDNASELAETKTLLADERKRGATVVSGDNKCFSRAVNLGLAIGDATFVAILNDDVVVTPGWDATMIAEAGEPGVGLVGAQSNKGGILQQDPVGAACLEARLLAFFCVVGRREVFKRVGPLDEETFFDWGGGEDVDYCLRTRQAGFKIVVSRAWVYHGGSQTYRSREIPEDKQAQGHALANMRVRAKHGAEAHDDALSEYPRILFGLLTGSHLVSVFFLQSLWRCRGTVGPYKLDVFHYARGIVHVARNAVALHAVDRGYSHVLFVDDDMIVPPDLVQRLLAANKDVVGTLAYQRLGDHLPCVFNWDKGANGYVPVHGVEKKGLLKVDAVGFGAVMIKVDVIKAMLEENAADPDMREQDRLREVFSWGRLGEDLGFCKRAVALGYEVWVDTDVILGHVGEPRVIDHVYVQKLAAAKQAGIGEF